MIHTLEPRLTLDAAEQAPLPACCVEWGHGLLEAYVRVNAHASASSSAEILEGQGFTSDQANRLYIAAEILHAQLTKLKTV
ncbi:MAG: hypothetical protein WBX11_00110 [Thiobacillaceae bacterium]